MAEVFGFTPATPKRGTATRSPRRLVRRRSRRRCAVTGLPPPDRPRDKCLTLIARGYTNSQIAQSLGISKTPSRTTSEQSWMRSEPHRGRPRLSLPPGRPRKPVVTRLAAHTSRLIHTLRFRSPQASLHDSPRSPEVAISTHVFADELCLRSDLGPHMCRLRSPRIDDVRPVRTSSSATPPSSTGSRCR